ncbi:MAG: hypothetical protein IIT65_02800 [Lachnospiraceae bacterium]|nr:hypothetical protein [Lachnospiraceae bacterium]
MAEIKTVIRADSTQHNQTVKKSANEIYKYQKKVDDTKKSMAEMGKGVKNVAGSFLGKLIPAVGGALTVMEGFKKMMKSTEEGTDALDRALYTAKSSVNQFFTAISTGSFDNFITGLKDIRKNAKEAYDALDNLGTVEMWVKIEKAKLNADMAIQRAIISSPSATQAEKEAAQRKLDLSQETFDRLGNIVENNLENAFNKRLKEVSGVGNQYVSIYDLNKWLGMRENDALNNTNTLKTMLDNYFKEHATVRTYQQTVYSPTGVAAYNQTKEDISWDSERSRQTYQAMKNLFNATDETINELGNLQIRISQQQQEIADRQNQVNRLNNKVNGNGGSGNGSGGNKTTSTTSTPTFEEGSLADLKSQLKELKDIYENVNLSIEEGAENLRKQHELEQQITEIENARAGIVSEEITPALAYEVGSLSDLKAQLSALKEIYENVNLSIEEGSENLRQQKEIEEQINEIEKQRAGIIDEIKVAMLDLDKVASSLSETSSAIGSIFNSLGEIAGETDGKFLKMFGDISGHISNILPKIFSLIAANEGEALAAGTASAAKLPFPYNLGAIASIVAELVAVFATISSYSKFAEGGIVGGNSTIGDYNLARVNKGEMILNGKQQSHLFNMLNGVGMPSNNGVSGNVVFRISGSDLVGTLNNYNSRTGRVR